MCSMVNIFEASILLKSLDDKKRPIHTECGHSLCTECIERHPICPICHRTTVEKDNFTVRAIFDSLKYQPLTVFKNWYYADISEPEICSGCFETSQRLRICVTCELSLNNLFVEEVRDDGTPWVDFGQSAEAERRLKKPPVNGAQEQPRKVRPRFRAPFNILANRVFCSDCILNEHEGHVVKTLEELEYSETDLKKLSSGIASGYLLKELKERKGNCFLKNMRMQRLCERLAHHALFYYPDPIKNPHREFHDFQPSKVNKFFEPSSSNCSELVSQDEGDSLIICLEEQLQVLNSGRNCDCEGIWNELHRLGFGNQVQKKYVDMINGLGYLTSFECPLSDVEISGLRERAIEMSKAKIFSVYTAFCWNHRKNDACCIFDNVHHKPVRCQNCKMSICMDCLQNDPNYKCSFCGNPYSEIGFFEAQDNTINYEALNLIEFYKEHCVDMFAKWWNCNAIDIGFCLSCNSYSDKLEICTSCELKQQIPALRPSLQETRLQFNYDGLATLPMRWQCEECEKRLQANWMHQYFGNSRLERRAGELNRGCNHLKSRLAKPQDKCEHKPIKLKDIPNYQYAMKVATMSLFQRILKAGIEGKVNCKLWKIRMLNIYGIMIGHLRCYFKTAMAGSEEDEPNDLRFKITFWIDHIKQEWNQYKSKKEQMCKCTEIWNCSDNDSRKKLKEIASFHRNEVVDRCPLQMEHGIFFEMSNSIRK
ncbi:hypothetical protein B9Z55_013770 [Caenorhabditis nigoni]|uniref:RING-type domain-containing protein n=2 Tax=Caenorhabditis nigoni TaxID=1611254 RepID=A0A2G5U371_9PELO|nr:hypothetical protein B9Z55_013770 [Caenorhabditis nigoni]